MTTSPEEAAALFDLPPPPAETPPPAQGTDDAEAALAAAEAALAAEFAATTEPGGVASDAPDSRSNRRVQVSWPARLRSPDGRVIALEVRNVSQRGVGLVSDQPIPADTVVAIEMDVPPFDGAGEPASVTGMIETTYTVVQGSRILCGGTWLHLAPADLDILDGWITRPGL